MRTVLPPQRCNFLSRYFVIPSAQRCIFTPARCMLDEAMISRCAAEDTFIYSGRPTHTHSCKHRFLHKYTKQIRRIPDERKCRKQSAKTASSCFEHQCVRLRNFPEIAPLKLRPGLHSHVKTQRNQDEKKVDEKRGIRTDLMCGKKVVCVCIDRRNLVFIRLECLILNLTMISLF